MIPLDRLLGWAGPASWLSWTSGPVELGRDSDLSAESACSVGVSGGWPSGVASRGVTYAAGVDVTAVT